jgi:hypothetical protein
MFWTVLRTRGVLSTPEFIRMVCGSEKLVNNLVIERINRVTFFKRVSLDAEWNSGEWVVGSMCTAVCSVHNPPTLPNQHLLKEEIADLSNALTIVPAQSCSSIISNEGMINPFDAIRKNHQIWSVSVSFSSAFGPLVEQRGVTQFC